MPTYEYICEKCGKEFSVILSIREYEKEKERMRCPGCKSRKVKQLLSSFIAKTSKKT
ncbi:MAG: zinc ribbon domain-containing protein [Syntrophorhabdaceae bacterium]|nr:zinc ribbon domain-containing protein [Syntrophorhabdaceae bacterium]